MMDHLKGGPLKRGNMEYKRLEFPEKDSGSRNRVGTDLKDGCQMTRIRAVGLGKSTFLEWLIRSQVRAGHTVLLEDIAGHFNDLRWSEEKQ